MNSKKSSKQVSKDAAKILNDPNSSHVQRRLAGSVISQVDRNKQTGAEMETVASNVLRSDKYNDATKKLAASVLAQSNKQRGN